MADGFMTDGKPNEATKIMTDMLKADPGWAGAAWMHHMADLNKSDNNPKFTAAIAEARKRLPR